jgi:UDP-N-acetylglucosamine--N-acetylmuramyl-(pentapeptide) pyrophosphoryl-undecaprenol N-acetylglucosamine transferase
MTKKCLTIMAGGTGGHVFPGIAIAQHLKEKGVAVKWMGTQGGLEKKWVEHAGIEFEAISIKGLRGNGLKGWLLAPIHIFRAFTQARKILKNQSADLVLGMGGFVCGPGGLAAKSLGLPLVIHEQNAIAGLTNKLLSPISTKVITAFDAKGLSSSKVIKLGNPVRESFEQIPVLTRKKSPLNLLVLGGSRGAQALNQTLPKALAILGNHFELQVLHQSGEKGFDEAKQVYLESALPAHIQVDLKPFIDDMASAYEQADLVLCRSGALTVSELMAVARPAIMVPYPHAVDDHQTDNAQALVDMAGGEIVKQVDLSPEVLANLLRKWLQDHVLRTEASMNIRLSSPKQATEKISEKLLELMKE